MSEHPIRTDLPPMPDRIRHLPIDPDRHIPVPWFVTWINGKPEFRVADSAKFQMAVANGLCWVCGQPLGRYLTFIIGPMCTINRVSAEPPSHLDCAEFSVKACPFLSKPKMVRREGGLPENTTCAGEMIARNPGVSCLWTTRDFKLVKDRQKGGILFRIGEPTDVRWFAEGRTASREEVLESINSGLPILQEMAAAEGSAALYELSKMVSASHRFLPLPCQEHQECNEKCGKNVEDSAGNAEERSITGV